MDINDIPQQIRTSLKYSLRSRSSFLFSLLGAMLVCGVAFNLLYDFLYSHIYNKKDSHYGPVFWIGLLTTCFGLPGIYAILSIVRARRLERPFAPGRFGIAIAPFNVVSLDPDTLGTSSKLRALDEIMTQLFTAQKRFIEEEQWSDRFEFRFLPPYVRILGKSDAEKRWRTMNALLIFSGQIVQQSGSGVLLRAQMLGLDTYITMDLPTIDIRMLETFLKYFVLSTAAYTEQKNGRLSESLKLYTLARTSAIALDRMANPGGTSTTNNVDRSINDLQQLIAAQI
jgi:hypothetical protein